MPPKNRNEAAGARIGDPALGLPASLVRYLGKKTTVKQLGQRDLKKLAFYRAVCSRADLEAVACVLSPVPRTPVRGEEMREALAFSEAVEAHDEDLLPECLSHGIISAHALERHLSEHAWRYFQRGVDRASFERFAKLHGALALEPDEPASFDREAFGPKLAYQLYERFRSRAGFEAYVERARSSADEPASEGAARLAISSEEAYAAWTLGIITAEERDRVPCALRHTPWPKSKKNARPRRL